MRVNLSPEEAIRNEKDDSQGAGDEHGCTNQVQLIEQVTHGNSHLLKMESRSRRSASSWSEFTARSHAS